MRITNLLTVIAALVAAVAPTTGAATTQPFRAELHEALRVCDAMVFDSAQP